MLRKVIITALTLTVLFFLIPLVIPGPGNTPTTEGETLAPETASWEDLESGKTLLVLLGDEVYEMDVNEYIWGVVAAEMPAAFETEALKAQSVAARTYALRNALADPPKHADVGADVCGDFACCQAYISLEQARENWGENADYYGQKITQAVAATGKEVILYDGALITAVFHSSSAEDTQAAVEVWGGDVPYLVSVQSPEGEEVPNFSTEVSFTAEEFRELLLPHYPEAVLDGAPYTWFGDVSYTSGGSVSEIVVGGVAVRGTQMRSIFSLRSASFGIETTESTVIFSVTGYGHGVGMSQYGANAMARSGSGYRDILTWYYQGVSVEVCPEDLWKA